jgi:hypothetical protein
MASTIALDYSLGSAAVVEKILTAVRILRRKNSPKAASCSSCTGDHTRVRKMAALLQEQSGGVGTGEFTRASGGGTSKGGRYEEPGMILSLGNAIMADFAGMDVQFWSVDARRAVL